MSADAQPSNAQPGMLRRGWITLFGAVIGAALVFGNEILVARFLGVPLYGLYALALVIARMAETVSLFGLRSGLLHFLPVFRKEGRNAEVVGAVLAGLILPLLLGFLSLSLIWLGAPWIAHTVLDEPAAVPYLRLFALPIPLMCLTEMLAVTTRGYERAEFYVVIRNLTPPACYMALLVMLILADGEPLWVGRAFMFAQFVATSVGVGIVVWLMRTNGTWTKPEFRLGEIYIYAWPILINTLLYTAMAASDVLMLGNMRGATEAGIYRACIQFRPAFDMAVLAFNAAAIHLYPVLHREKRFAELDQGFDTVIRMTTAVTCCLFVMVFLNCADILGLLGPEFPTARTAMMFLLLGFFFQGCCGSAGILLVVTGHQKLETTAAFIALLINIGLNVILIPTYGVTGAAIATASALFVLNALRVRHVWRHLQLRTLRPYLWRSMAITAPVGIVVFVLAESTNFGDGSGFLSMVGRSIIITILLFFGFWRFGPKAKSK